jgi:hypothetical protein
MRVIYLIIASLFLSACSIQGMVEKTTPESVRADHTAHIDKLLAADSTRMQRAFDLDMADETVKANIATVFENVPGGEEIRRDYVGFESSSGFNTGEGKSRSISITTEVQTTEGFMTVQGLYGLDPDGECCALRNINVQKYESSPVRVMWETLGKVGKFAGLFLVGIIVLTVLLVMRSNKKKRAAREVG